MFKDFVGLVGESIILVIDKNEVIVLIVISDVDIGLVIFIKVMN